MRHRGAVVAGAVLAVLLALPACGTVSDPPPELLDPSEGRGPVDLVDLWRVDAPSEQGDTWLRLDGTGFVLWRGRGMVHGGFRAAETAFAAGTWGFSGDDTSRVETWSVDWLDGVHAYRWTDTGWEVLDDDGGPLATMTIDGAPAPIDSAADTYTERPEVTDEIRAELAAPEPLPDGLAPASDSDLRGRWVPAGAPLENDPHVVFETQSWHGTDGCNGGGGAWLLTDDGVLLATESPSTAMWCEGVVVPSWVGGAARAGFDGDELVLLDRDGAELGRLVRD